MGRLNGRVSVITGAASGIGRSAALRFAEEGAIVVVIDVDGSGAAETVDLAERTGATACWFTSDVTDSADVDRIASEVHQRFG